MVNLLKIAEDTTHNKTSWTEGSISIDMTLMNPTFTFNLSNPIIIIPPPTPKTPDAIGYKNSNAVGINIGMMYPTITINFIEKAAGLGSDPFNITQGNMFQRMYYLSVMDKYRKLLFVNTTTNPQFVHIMDWKCSVQPGQKNITNNTLVLAVVGSDSM